MKLEVKPQDGQWVLMLGNRVIGRTKERHEADLAKETLQEWRGSKRRFPFRVGHYVQHVSGTGERFIVRLVDDDVYEAFAESVESLRGTRIINPGNWKRIAVEEL